MRLVRSIVIIAALASALGVSPFGASPARAFTTYENIPLPRGSIEALEQHPALPAALDDEDKAAAKTSASQTSEDPEALRQALLRVAQTYSNKTYIPYIWGGSAIGDQATCEACRSCIGAKHHLRVERRQNACQACRQCGVDCSHFVQRLYGDVGLKIPYLPTNKMRHLTAAKLRQLGLVDVGRDLQKARPGDLLVTRRHVVMLLALRGGTVGDFIHVSRSIKRGRIGGVEVVRNKDLVRYRGKIMRILRHVALDGPGGKPAAPTIDPGTLDLARQLVVYVD